MPAEWTQSPIEASILNTLNLEMVVGENLREAQQEQYAVPMH